MLRRTTVSLEKLYKLQKGKMDRMTNFQRKRVFRKRSKYSIQTVDGETVKGAGKEMRRQTDDIADAMEQMEDPMIWLWYPWRLNPEPPQYDLPKTRALKNLHGAVYQDLSPEQKQLEEKWMYGASIPSSRTEQHDKKHPFLARVIKDLEGQAHGFPFWYKKYPSRRYAYEYRFHIPKEMLDGYSDDVKKALSHEMSSWNDKTKAEKARYAERYAEHALDDSSPAVMCTNLAVQVRQIRNHLLTNPHNTVFKNRLAKKERLLNASLRRLRKLNFKQYWEIIRNHDIQDIIQPNNNVSYRWGGYWRFDWNSGLGINTNVADFMDPKGLSGCVETGRSRAEVARDLGMTYTRTLNDSEKKQLSHAAMYYERLQRFKSTQPEAWRERMRAQFTRKFSGMFAKMNRKSQAYDFPSRYRADVGTRLLRWKSARHGPM